MSENELRRGSPGNGAPESDPPATPPLAEEERRALAALPGALSPPPDLEERLVVALRREGLVSDSSRTASSSALLVAASVLALALGLAAGWLLRDARGNGGELAEPEPSHLLALYEAPGASTDEAEHRRLATEYAAWARERAARGELLAGEPLAPEGWLLAPGAAPAAAATVPSVTQPELVGYFLIHAPDRERALEIAADCPHLRHGGSVLVRPIRD